MARSAVSKGTTLGKVGSSVGVEGVEQIKANIAERIDRFTALQAKKVFMRAGLLLAREERDAVQHLTDDPHLTGKLEGAIFAAYGDPKKPNVLVGVKRRGQGKAPHAYPVAHGHGGPAPAPAHPWVPESVQATRGAMAAIIAQGLKELVEKP
jgi:hypothetical protein